MFRTSVLLRTLGRTALILYLLVTALFLVAKYAILPNIDHWRPKIQTYLSSALETHITLGRIKASWQGLHPRFELNDIAFFDDDGKRVLALPVIHATLTWKGLLSGSPRFAYIEATGLELELRRDRQQKIWVLGKAVDIQASPEASQLTLDDPVIQWLAKQPRVALRNASITWRDETRSNGPLRLEAVTLGLASEPGQHRILLAATPPPALGRRLEMRAQFEHTDTGLASTDAQAWEGVAYAHVDGMFPAQWRPWVDMPGNMRSGDVSAKWWMTFAQAKPQRLVAQAKIEAGHWALGGEDTVRADQLELAVDGPASGYAAVIEAIETMLTPSAPLPAFASAESIETAAVAEAPGSAFPTDLPVEIDVATQFEGGSGKATLASFQADARGLVLEVPGTFDQALSFERIEIRGDLQNTETGQLAARIESAHLVNQDMNLQFSGAWREGGDGQAGLADLKGLFSYASLDGIDLYLPDSVNLEAREWLINGLLDGYLENATVVLQGDLMRFPFGDGSGSFRIEGSVRDGVIDYAPDRTGRAGWPALRQVNGRASLDRVDLRIVADDAVVNPVPDQAIQLRNVKARIPNIERNSVLSIEGETQAPAPAYLALARHSPLQRLLDGFLDPAQADGNWQVPLRLEIPLLNVDDTRVRGEVQFQGGMLALEPETPPFEQVNGMLEFSETGFSVGNLSAQFLGGTADFSGGIGAERQGLNMKGRISAKALEAYVGMKGMQRLSGSLAYQAQLRRQPSGRYALMAQSNLQGLAVDLPAPVGKSRDEERKLEVQWTPASADSQMYLNVALGPNLQGRFLRRQGTIEGPYFHTGAIGTTLPDKLPAAGMLVDARYPHIDVNEWNDIVDEFSTQLEASGGSGRALFPPVQRIRLQADNMSLYGLALQNTTLTVQRERPLHWRMDVASAQTAGTLFWHQADDGSAGRVDAQFDRLALGDTSESVGVNADALLDAAEEDGSWDKEVDLPAVDLTVDKLTLYGRFVGKLKVEGLSEQQGRFWRLNQLSLTSPSATLRGSGIWRLTGRQRGLTLDADVRFGDAGAFLDQIDMQQVMEGGQGALKGRFEWRNMPWRFNRADLNGQLRLELEQGRFSTLNSRSARVLELLSLQSLQRIATFSVSPASLFKEGFPFDRIAGTLHIHNGVMTTNDYNLDSSVATISIAGDVDLKSEGIDLQAMVVPKLDVSGASVAAGIAINPIVGLGAFVTQWLLSKPLSKAMTMHYEVTGDLSDPQLRELSAPQAAEPQPATSTLQGEPIEGGQVDLDNADGKGLRDADELNATP